MGLLQGYVITRDEHNNQITHTLLYANMHSAVSSLQLLLAMDSNNGAVISAYRKENDVKIDREHCWNNKIAQRYTEIIGYALTTVGKCKLLKNGKLPKASKLQLTTSATAQGIALNYSGTVKAYSFVVSKLQKNNELISIRIEGTDNTLIVLQENSSAQLLESFNSVVKQLKFVETSYIDKTKLTDIKSAQESEEDDLMSRRVRTIDEVALTKDTSWLKTKQYYVIKDPSVAEQIFTALESYDGLISYDVETTGLNVNKFCEIGSAAKQELEEYNARVDKELQIKADRLTGFSFCIQPNVAYYFPCFHRKFANLYDDKTNATTIKVCERIKSRYVIGDLHTATSAIASYIRKTPYTEWESDVILMERCRDILEKHKILAHHGSFEWKVNWCYHIDTNLTEDTMILHQLAFKWKNVRTHSGEPSNLKYLSKTVLGIDQLSLEDFFADFHEAETTSEVRSASKASKKKNSKKKKKAVIDFSYMGEEETRCYAPADVDLTLQLWYKFKTDMLREFPDLEYLYGVEILTACAIGYAEFYGLHINEEKINNAKYEALVSMAKDEHSIREFNNLCSAEECEAYNKLIALWEEKNPTDDKEPNSSITDEVLEEAIDSLSGIIEQLGNLNLGAPGQVGELLYTKYNWKTDEDGKKSMGKKVIKQYEKLKDNDGKPLYPEVIWYRNWKDNSTLITKFFDKLADFMWPSGYLFSSFGQIACATGRMSSKKPNFQQMPGNITKIIEPSKGFVFFDGDFSQIEYRCLCALAGETSLIEAFADADMDYHQKMASLMFGVPYALVSDAMRKSAKTFNFGIPYGMGITSLAIQLHGNKNKAAVEDAKEKYELYFKEQPKVRQFFVDTKDKARYNEYTKTKYGRRRYFKFTDENGNVDQRLIASGLRQAGNAIIQGTARDIFGIAVARAFQSIRNNDLLGKVRMCNFIHDEVLYEISAEVNVLAAVGMILEAMQLVIPEFPPLFVGGGIGPSWKTAKGSMNEIHPTLGYKIIEMYHEGVVPTEFDGTVESVYKYFTDLVFNFRVNKVADYIASLEYSLRTNTEILGLDPAIGKLLGLQFEGGVDKKINNAIKDYKTQCTALGKEPDANKLEQLQQKIVPLRLEQFIFDFEDAIKTALTKKGFNLTAESDLHNLMLIQYLKDSYGINIEEDEDYLAYSDDDEDDFDDISEFEFELIDESNEMYGVSVIDIAKAFGMAVIPGRGICCVYIGNKTREQIQRLAELFDEHQCDEEDEGAMRVELVRGDNYVLKPGVYVNDLTSNDVIEQLA